MKFPKDISSMMSYQINSFQRSITNPFSSANSKKSEPDTMTESPPPTPTVKFMTIPPLPFGTGGDVFIENAKVSAEPDDESKNTTNFTVSFKVPTSRLSELTSSSPEDYQNAHRLNISITIKSAAEAKRPETDYEFVQSNKRVLEQCGFYYGRMDWQESVSLLKNTPIGTFLVRDSSDPHYLFSLSCQTQFGPISSRISYSNKKFRLDCSDRVSHMMPAFDSVLELVEHYVKHGMVKDVSGKQVWVDSFGRTFSPVHLTNPKLKSPMTLKHSARLILNKTIPKEKMKSVVIPPGLKCYMDKYPYKV